MAWRAASLRRWGGPSFDSGRLFTRGQKALLLACLAAIIVLRLPQAWLHGRFLDEEGTIFFAYAWHRPPGEALFRSFAGYLNLGANAVTLLAVRLIRAGVLPIERAPYLTMTVALLIQLIPAVLMLNGRAGWLANRWTVVAGLLTLGIVPMTEEVFVNVLHIQFHLALCTALILALDPPRSIGGHVGCGMVLLLAPLCGPGAIVMLPLFVARWLADRDPTRLAQTAILSAGAVLQLLLFFSRSPVRGHLLEPATLAAVLFVRLAALPFLGEALANALGRAVHVSLVGGGIWWWGAVAGAVGYFGALVALALRGRRDGAVWLILSGLAIAAVSFGGGMLVVDSREWFSVGAGERYDFLPLVLLTLGMMALAGRPGGEWRRTCFALCALTFFWSAIYYWRPLKELSEGPIWPDEVALWRRHPDHSPSAWPRSWTVDLSDRTLACSATGLRPVPPSEPDYCEAAWRARIAQPPVLAGMTK